MSAGRVVALLVAGLALVGFAMWIASQRHLERATLAGDLVLPDLEHHVNAVTEVALRSEEHTSELQSRENLVCRLLLEKKKIYITHHRARKFHIPLATNL